MIIFRLLVTEDLLFSSSYDHTAKAWLLNTSGIQKGDEELACIRTYDGHSKGIYSLIFVPADESMADFDTVGDVLHFGDVLITGSADGTAKSWSTESGRCLKVT